MSKVVRVGYTFMRGRQVFEGGDIVPDVSSTEMAQQGWKLENVKKAISKPPLDKMIKTPPEVK